MGLFDGLISPAAVGGAFAQGMQTGRAEREDREVKGALSAYAMNPDDPQAFQTLAQYKPQLAIQIRQDQTKRAQEARIQALTASAAQGDKAAAAQLAGIDFDKWDKLQDNQRQALKGQVDYVGNAALQISRLPADQRPAAWDQAIEEGVRLGYSGLAEHRGRYSEQGLQAAIANAGQVSKFIEMTQPDYKALPWEADLYNANDPASVQELARLRAARDGSGAPATAANGNAAPPAQTKTIGGKTYYQYNGSWHDSPLEGGQTASPSGTFR